METQWIAEARCGDKEAFSNLVEKYQRPVFSVCYRMLGTPTAAEDAAQEAFIRAYQSLDRYDQKRSFTTWLLSIASNYCIDQLRKKKVTILSIDNDKHAWLAPPDPGPSPEKAALDKEKNALVKSILAALPETDRAAIILQYWHDYSHAQIAETMDLSSSAVKSRLFRSRKLMAEKWQEMQLTSVNPLNTTPKMIAHETSIL
ncbi:MAG TPA: sigma-70 family RNA polymerase sigma factor [Anaerolineales bacterium]|jgi:RNA polymerase sigma-70 factor (ECF subfamily)|nr:sigma-70 family RNA polymerase sigma factor [Anaerolineales bacterium]